jgi:predicted flap endonuclease-1-like 5' DNA nuclease
MWVVQLKVGKKNKRPRFDLTMIAGIGEIIAERISG